MSSEPGLFEAFANWMAEHWPWVSGLGIFLGWAVKKVYDFFQGVNRQAEATKELAIELKAQREKLDRMMDAEGVDLRVAPVIREVSIIRGQISQIHDHLMNREDKRDRATDKDAGV